MKKTYLNKIYYIKAEIENGTDIKEGNQTTNTLKNLTEANIKFATTPELSATVSLTDCESRVDITNNTAGTLRTEPEEYTETHSSCGAGTCSGENVKVIK